MSITRSVTQTVSAVADVAINTGKAISTAMQLANDELDYLVEARKLTRDSAMRTHRDNVTTTYMDNYVTTKEERIKIAERLDKIQIDESVKSKLEALEEACAF